VQQFYSVGERFDILLRSGNLAERKKAGNSKAFIGARLKVEMISMGAFRR